MSTTRYRETMRTPALIAATALAVSASGCGAAATNYYRTAMAKQEQCCDRLGDAATQETCRAQILRVDNEAAETADVNRETFQCVDRYFQCDAASGRATQDSAQAQLDCLNDLGSSAP